MGRTPVRQSDAYDDLYYYDLQFLYDYYDQDYYYLYFLYDFYDYDNYCHGYDHDAGLENQTGLKNQTGKLVNGSSCRCGAYTCKAVRRLRLPLLLLTPVENQTGNDYCHGYDHDAGLENETGLKNQIGKLVNGSSCRCGEYTCKAVRRLRRRPLPLLLLTPVWKTRPV